MVHRELLDLEDKATLREDPTKLIYLTESDNMVFMREEKKGIKVLSCEDGSLVVNIPKVHKNPILHINVSRSTKWVVTCGRDKRAIVTDWMSNTRLALLKDHEDAVTFGTFCKDDAYLFTASTDKKINMYNTYNWHRVYKFKAGFEVDFIEFS